MHSALKLRAALCSVTHDLDMAPAPVSAPPGQTKECHPTHVLGLSQCPSQALLDALRNSPSSNSVQATALPSGDKNKEIAVAEMWPVLCQGLSHGSRKSL